MSPTQQNTQNLLRRFPVRHNCSINHLLMAFFSTNSENEKAPGCTRMEPLSLDKDISGKFSCRFGAEGGSGREGGRSECSLHQQQPKLAFTGKGLLGCGREADTIPLQSFSGLFLRNIKERPNPQGQDITQDGGSRVLAMLSSGCTDTGLSCISGSWHLPPGLCLLCRKGKIISIYLLHGSF